MKPIRTARRANAPFGFGIAAARTPQPAVVRRRSIVSHLSYGLGLYLAALVVRALVP
ncbi:DUF2938 family protein [Burkholderia sp. Bp8963]|nr:DUF2938 family protein [Burkholderia sp. Bp8963]